MLQTAHADNVQPWFAHSVPQAPTGFGDVNATYAHGTAAQTSRLPPPPRTPPPPSLSAMPPSPNQSLNLITPPTQSSSGSAASSEPIPAQPGYVTPGGIFWTEEDESSEAQRNRKSRIAFILLGIFFGWLGAHNFYAGQRKLGAIQLCISVFTLFYGAIISWIWAVVEVCTVSRDSEDVSFI